MWFLVMPSAAPNFSFATVVSQIVFDTNRNSLAILRKSYNLADPYFGMEEKRTMPICFTSDQLKLIEDYAKRKGMLNLSQAVEHLVTK
jgi:hypothetical protein